MDTLYLLAVVYYIKPIILYKSLKYTHYYLFYLYSINCLFIQHAIIFRIWAFDK